MERHGNGISRRRVLWGAGAAVALTALSPPTRTGAITRGGAAVPGESGRRADLAERAIVTRHVRSLWGLPQRQLGTLVWPASLTDQSFGRWCYWWQAHLVDCAIDAAERARTPERVDRVVALARGIRTRNVTGWTNRYYDDMAWLLLALDRARRLPGVCFEDAVNDLRGAVVEGWNPKLGAVPWRSGDDFYNTPAIGPTGIALARLGDLARAARLAEFLHTRLRDPASGLVLDGVHEPGGAVDRTVHTYCQGVAIGLDTELFSRTGDPVYRERAAVLVAVVDDLLTDNGVIIGATDDDSGLFMGILARYLSETALALGDPTAARIVRTSARAAWAHRGEVDGLPLFGSDWSRPVSVAATLSQLGDTGTEPPRDLSVQLSGWMLLEADCRLSAAGY
ncbi:glycoside hydrolase family 76 protein [Nocardia caishijiensis]|uniref:Alpha-1,6-mannanase (GH76 family) n=1 Tax=Nocardia caishijiensis TaxID=184756 RepID=A0ABQ6YLZ0_9NOCA|nr:glycoside hydrolase family 76 protein [Nocardia caishijiensis]KAF0846810.1 putative alpha-1,6-mannanase (GH76 family) [Nocardia caishijiensis]